MLDVATEAARFIAAHADERIRLADVADHVGYSPFHLARSFERRLGLPPGQFLAAHRFQRAKQLLLADDHRIIDICFAVGFTSVGTFTRRFTADVGVCPTEFRRLPDSLSDAPPEPVHVPGPLRQGGIVTGSVRLSAAAQTTLRDTAAIYVGLFPRRAPRGRPVSGALLDPTGDFMLTGVPAGTYWLLSTAFPARADTTAQLVPAWNVVGGSPQPLRVSQRHTCHHRDVHLDVAAEWTTPVLVALPPLASPTAQNRRRHARPAAIH
ncbi:helix-turn-helix domain-containing protein [Saccharopolyspora phatthalungensis]|uniref:AraC-like DNA-binding protein n=1 Tax=Saccharopolyspora phatthalungensis TaxID=664693 RepID=A0A840Q333_9PSEU|nr:AraC family transcriptional regulator [Saccharopolyspora phatthalungensis]MBB5154906.1 AraC-like DNA-binding protein [Saccharopolyspora phatthalungensis]